LDSHLSGPEKLINFSSGERFHVFFDIPIIEDTAKWIENSNAIHKSEMITVNELTEGLYRYSINHFSGSSEISLSNVEIKLFLPDGQKFSFVPPPNPSSQGQGDVWIVFDLMIDNLRNFTVIPVNRFDHIDILQFLNPEFNNFPF
jgi:hypothetical protein